VPQSCCFPNPVPLASIQVKPPRRSQAIGNETKNGDFLMGFDGDLLESMEFAGDFIGSFYGFFSGDLVGLGF